MVYGGHLVHNVQIFVQCGEFEPETGHGHQMSLSRVAFLAHSPTRLENGISNHTK